MASLASVCKSFILTTGYNFKLGARAIAAFDPKRGTCVLIRLGESTRQNNLRQGLSFADEYGHNGHATMFVRSTSETMQEKHTRPFSGIGRS